MITKQENTERNKTLSVVPFHLACWDCHFKKGLISCNCDLKKFGSEINNIINKEMQKDILLSKEEIKTALNQNVGLKNE